VSAMRGDGREHGGDDAIGIVEHDHELGEMKRLQSLELRGREADSIFPGGQERRGTVLLFQSQQITDVFVGVAMMIREGQVVERPDAAMTTVA